MDNQTIQLNNVVCSNMTHFESLVKILLSCHGLLHVDYPLRHGQRCNSSSPLRIDAICDNGAKWIKVIARNPRAIEDAVHGRASYGTKSVVDMAKEYVEVSETNLHFYKAPQIQFVFSQPVSQELKEMLTQTGVQVRSLSDFSSGNADPSSTISEHITTLNLDITCLLAYISSLTNPSADHQMGYWQFSEPLLTEQSQWESRNQVKPILDKVFENRRLICCETARESFMEITNLLGGPNEKRRALELMAKVQVLPDVESLGEMSNLKVGGRVKERSLKIFAFGMKHGAATATSNHGFIRSAKMNGIEVPAFVHEARALTEAKEINGKWICVNLKQTE